MADDQDADLVEHVTVGDYDLVLWFSRRLKMHAVSLSSGQEDPTTLVGQKAQPKPQRLQWGQVEVQLQKWVKTYGKILIGSTNTAKTDQYRRLLSRNFLIGTWSDHPAAGFFILPD